MQLDSLRNNALNVPEQQLPLPVMEALRLFRETRLDVLPVLERADYLKGLNFMDALPLISDCTSGHACRDSVPGAVLSEIPYIDISAPEHEQIESMKYAIEHKSSAAVLSGGIYLGMIPLMELVQFVNVHKIEEAQETSPLTGLPGNISIKREFDRRCHSGEIFNMCYWDISDFKPFNDKHGISKGNDVILFAAYVLTQNCTGGFVGHVGGDDFMFFLPSGNVDGILDHIVADFDGGIRTFYDESDRSEGGIISVDRDGKPRFFPIMTTAISVTSIDSVLDFEAVTKFLMQTMKFSAKKKSKEGGRSLYATAQFK